MSEIVGLHVSVWWEGDDRYFQGKVVDYSGAWQMHLVKYDDGDQKWHYLVGPESEDHQLLGTPAPEPAAEEAEEDEEEEQEEQEEEGADVDDDFEEEEEEEEEREPAPKRKKKLKATIDKASLGGSGRSAPVKVKPPLGAKLKAKSAVKAEGHTYSDAIEMLKKDGEFSFDHKKEFTNVGFGPFDAAQTRDNNRKFLLCVQKRGGIFARHLFVSKVTGLTYADRRANTTKGASDTGGSHHYLISKKVTLKRIKSECSKLARMSKNGLLNKELGREGLAEGGLDADEE